MPVYILTAHVKDEEGRVRARRHAPFIVCRDDERHEDLIEELERIVERLETIVEDAL